MIFIIVLAKYWCGKIAHQPMATRIRTHAEGDLVHLLKGRLKWHSKHVCIYKSLIHVGLI